MTAPAFLPKSLPAFMATEDVMKALGRYTREVDEDDRRTAAILGIKRSTLAGWLRGGDPPQKRILARVAGFLRRVGYLSANQGDYGTLKQEREQLREALALTRKLEHTTSQLHDKLDALEDAQRQLVAQERQPPNGT